MRYDNIVIVTQDFYPALGGINTFSLEIAKYFSSRGKQVTVITKEYSSNHPFKELDLGFDIIRLPDKKWKQKKYSLIKQILYQYNFKNTLFIGTNWKMSVPMFYISLLKRINYITAIHGLDVFEGRKINRFLQLSVFKNSKLITYASNYTKEQLPLKKIQKPTHYIMNNGYDDTEFFPDKDFDAISSLYPSINQPYVFCFGRLVERKGFDRTIEALSKVNGVHLVIAGDGEYKNTLEKIVAINNLENRVHFIGKVVDSVLRKLYSCALVYSMPSRTINKTDFEGFGITYLEAAACGTLSIGGLKSGAEDAIVDDYTGFLVNPSNVNEIANKIIKLKENENLRLSMGESARVRAENEFKWSRIVGNLEDKISSLSK